MVAVSLNSIDFVGGQPALRYKYYDHNITAISPVGNYAVKLTFSDGHDTGLYSWDYLYELASHYEALWRDYIGRLEMAGVKRKTDSNA